MSVTPIWVDFVKQPQGGDDIRGQFYGPWVLGTDQFVAANNYAGPLVPPDVLRMYKSSDFGTTWVEQDVANEPQMSGDQICYIRDGNTIRTARYLPGFTFAFRDFNLTTGLWGADYGAAGAPAFPNQGILGVLVLTTGALRIFYARFAAGTRTLLFADYKAGWLSIDNVIASAVGFPFLSQPGLIYDTVNMLSHGFFSQRPVAPNHQYYHYSITNPGVVTIDALPCYVDRTGNSIHNVILVAGDLQVAHRDEIAGFYYPARLVGSPAAAPVWTDETVDLTDGTTAGVWITEQAGEVRIWWGFSNFGGVPPVDQFYYSIRGPIAWGPKVTYWDRLLNPPVPDPDPAAFKNLYGPSILVYPDGVTFGGWYGVVITADAPVGPMTPIFLKLPASAAVACSITILAPAPAPGPQTQGAWRRMTVLVPNVFDLCLHRELQAYLANQPKKACCEPILYRDITWLRAPADYIPFRKVGAIPTPLAASGDVEVLNFQVPQGYDGLIAGLFNMYTGPGFRDGNGDIEWRLQINRVYAVQLGRILVTLGSRQQPYPVDGGIFIQSGTRIRYIVNVPNLSGGVLPLNSQIVCGLEGLFYARA